MAASKVLVVGSGVIGLRTALELLRRRVGVSLLSPRHPLHPSTCSMGAGGLWMPFHCDDSRTDQWSFETLSELIDLSSSGSKSGQSPNHGRGSIVEILPAVAFQQNGQSQIPGWATDAKSKCLLFQQLSVDELYRESKVRNIRLPRKEVIDDAGYSHSWFFQTPIIDSPKMLTLMLDEIKSNQYTDHVNVETNKYYTTMEEMVQEARALGCDGLANCTGLGSRQLCKDDSLVGARGILLHYDRASCKWSKDTQESGEGKDRSKDAVILIEDPPFGSDTMPCYMIPRGDIIAVGGTYLEGDNEAEIRQSERERVISNAQTMGINVQETKPVGEWVGFRPYRPTSRLEVDEELSSMSGVRVVHSYGYGGSGWTVFVGAAKEAASLIVK